MIEFDLDFEDYKARPGVNASSFGAIDPDRDGCPAIWNARQQVKEDIEDTAALSFGRAFHKYCLEFERFDDEYVPLTENKKEELFNNALANGSKAKGFSKTLTTYKEWKKELSESGVSIIDESTYDTLARMRKSLTESCTDGIISAGDRETEVSVFVDLEDHRGNKVACKGRLDLLKPFSRIVDLKTVASASPVALGRFIAKFKLHVQAAFYLDMVKTMNDTDDDPRDMKFAWCFVDKRSPHPCVWYEASDALIKLGRQEYRSYLGWIHDGRESGHWPGHSQMIEFSGWFESLLEQV